MSKQDYKQIVRASALTGSAKVVDMGAAFVRMKLVAVLAGTHGVGLLGLYSSALGLVSAATSLGLGSSAVRDVAASAGKSDTQRISSVVTALRRLTWLTGLIGATACLLCSSALSQWTFGDDKHAEYIAALSLCALLAQLSAGQAALLRGLRKILELAKQSIAISISGLLAAGLIFWGWGADGTVPFLIALHALTLAVTWWHARKIKIEPVSQSWPETLRIGRSMIAMGLAFQISGLASALVAHVVGILLLNSGGLQLNAYYQAAWGSTGVLVGLVLGAMGQDFYPRLAAIAEDGPAAARLIDQQTEVGILLALPMLALLAALAPVLIPLLYSNDFLPAADAVHWFALGAFGKVVSWPMGFYLIAAGLGKWYVATEVVFSGIHLALAYWLIDSKGLEGAGIAYLGLYVLYTLAMVMLTSRMTRQPKGWSSIALSAGGVLVMGAASLLGPLLGSLMVLPIGLLCLRSLVRRIGTDNQMAARLMGIPLLGKFLSS